MNRENKPEKDVFRILSPTAILGYGFPLDSFERGLEMRPDLIAVDAGSTDPGPYYLGAGKSFVDRSSVKRDLGLLLSAAVKRGIPLIVGSAGGSGAEPHLEWCLRIVEEIAREEGLSFRLGIIHADVEKSRVLKALREDRISPVRGAPELAEEAVEASVRIVAQMGAEPIIDALDAGCDVVLAGRCYDPAVFAALPIRRGFGAGLALHLGKILECAAIAADPGSGADCVFGTLEKESFVLETLNPKRRFTAESTAAHTLYEKSDPAHLPGPGGILDLEKCVFEELAGGRVRVRGSRFERTEYRVKLEGARRTGFRTICVAGVRDPIMIESVEEILASVERRVEEVLREEGIEGRFHIHVYGRNGVMADWEPVERPASHELCLVLEAVGRTQAEADTACGVLRSTLLHYGYPGRISTAGNLAFPFSPSDVPTGEVYEFSVYHLMEADPRELFPVTVLEIGSGKEGAE